MKTEYDPTNVRAHANKTYKTENSTYSFGPLATFHGRDSIEGIVPELVAGIDPENNCSVCFLIEEKNRKGLYDFVMENAREPVEGRHLVLVLSEEDAKKTERIGFKSSRLEEIE